MGGSHGYKIIGSPWTGRLHERGAFSIKKIRVAVPRVPEFQVPCAKNVRDNSDKTHYTIEQPIPGSRFSRNPVSSQKCRTLSLTAARFRALRRKPQFSRTALWHFAAPNNCFQDPGLLSASGWGNNPANPKMVVSQSFRNHFHSIRTRYISRSIITIGKSINEARVIFKCPCVQLCDPQDLMTNRRKRSKRGVSVSRFDNAGSKV